ncbi:transposase [Roseomonas gilardii]
MAEKRTRRRFTAEFKTEAVRRLLEDGRGLSEVATDGCVHEFRPPLS